MPVRATPERSRGAANRPDDAREGFDAVIDRFETFSAGLVRLEPFSLPEIRRTVGQFIDQLRGHLEAARFVPDRLAPVGPRERRLEAEHQRFYSSIEQLHEILSVVEREDHGGHRQALGQYGRIVTEALRRHRADEGYGPAEARPGRGPGNHN